jgi:hypothetical protein
MGKFKPYSEFRRETENIGGNRAGMTCGGMDKTMKDNMIEFATRTPFELSCVAAGHRTLNYYIDYTMKFFNYGFINSNRDVK